MPPLNSLQILRFLAAWMVVFHHYMQAVHNLSYSSMSGKFFSEIGSFSVMVFFVISGFIMHYSLAHRACTAREFILRRMVRIIPAYWIATLLFIPTLILFPSGWSSSFFKWNVGSLLESLSFVPHHNPSGIGIYPLLTVGWSLNYELFYYLFLGAMLWAFQKKWFFPCTISLLVLPAVWPNHWFYATILDSDKLYMFAYGMIISVLYLNRQSFFEKSNTHASLTIGIGLALAVLLYFTLGPIQHRHRLDFLMKTTLAVSIVGGFVMNEKQINRIPYLCLFRHLGNASYSTYLLHPIALCIAMSFSKSIQSTTGEAGLIATYGALTMTLSNLSYQFVENSPMTKALKKKINDGISRSTFNVGEEPAPASCPLAARQSNPS